MKIKPIYTFIAFLLIIISLLGYFGFKTPSEVNEADKTNIIQRIEKVESSVEKLEDCMNEIENEGIEDQTTIKHLEKRFDRLEDKFEKRFQKQDEKLDNNFKELRDLISSLDKKKIENDKQTYFSWSKKW